MDKTKAQYASDLLHHFGKVTGRVSYEDYFVVSISFSSYESDAQQGHLA